MPPKLSMETIMDTIKSTFELMFKEHEENIKNIISKYRKEESEKLDTLRKEVNDIKVSLEFTQATLKDELAAIKNENESLKNELERIKDRVISQEDRSRRNNLRFDGIAEVVDETWEKTEALVQDFLKTKLEVNNVENIVIERAHRVSKKVQGKPRTIVVKFFNFKDKSNILSKCKKLKDLPFSVYEDFSRETAEIRKTLWKEVLRNRAENKISYLSYKTVVCKDR